MAKGRQRKSNYGHRRRRSRRRSSWRLSLSEILVLVSLPALALYLMVENSDWSAARKPKPAHRLTMEEAREFNNAVPFVEGPLKPARSYVFKGSSASRLQATECLATAALYEAGRDEEGQKAVMQVVLNRVRSRGFPGTVCGVVYQGSSRKTGCQFTFTCDGSLKRRPVKDGWAAARKRARRALGGYVFAEVGTATHYHTDWIVPWWSSSLAKIAQIDTHIFYRTRRT